MFDLKDKTVLVTGASSGIGAACAEIFAQAGASLILAARRKERLEQLSKSLQERFGTVSVVMPVDVSRVDELSAAYEALPAVAKEVDILINNAGLVKGLEREWEVTPDDADVMIDTNIKGLLTMTRLVVPGMLERGAGHIINIGSISGQEVYPGGGVYCATKFATEFSIVRFHGDEKQAAQAYKGLTPLGPEDVADAVLFAATRPQHVNISEVLILPTDQASARMVHREQE
jgi:NADP-dependent 3-hydroxy acid dehydrogenase YdfG